MPLKPKKSLSAFFRLAMRNSTKKPPIPAAITSETNPEDSSVIEDYLVDALHNLRFPSLTTLAKPTNDSLKTAMEMLDCLSTRGKQMSRGRVQTGNYMKKQTQFMKKLSKGCVGKLGTETMLDVLSKMGKEAGEKEYNTRIQICIENARRSNDLEYVGKAIEYLKEMRKLGFVIDEETYGSFFEYLIGMEMVEEFGVFKEFIKEGSPESVGKLAYYEMLLWIQVGDEMKIEEVCDSIDGSGISLSVQQEYYLVALCENDRKENLQKLLEIVDITKVSLPDVLESIFGYLGKSLLESVAMKLLCELRDCNKDGVEKVSNHILSYATCILNTTVEDVILKFKKLHQELEIAPSSISYEKLVGYLCGSNEVAVALDVVENMSEDNLVISANILHSLLDAIEQILEFNLVQRFHSIMSNKSVKPKSETFRRAISLCTKIKDFEGAYNMLGNLKNFDLTPNSCMYNSILAGYFREKKVDRALLVLKEMKEADVKPDSVTYSYLINCCSQEGAIAKYYEDMKQAGVQANKHVYMSLIKAYASCKQFDKAKQVLVDLEVPTTDHNELKSCLISSLASNGNIRDALTIYEEMKKACLPVESKTILSLIDNSDPNEDMTTLIQLADELRDYKYWIDGFFKVILFAVRNNNSSSVLDLLKETKNHLSKDDVTVEYWFEEVFRSIAETKPSDVKLGIELLSFMKEEIELCPSRKCLDFLLHACVNAKDKQNALMVWKEYQIAELPYNVFNYLRMYQVLVAAGDSESAKAMAVATKIHSDDRDVKFIIKESSVVFTPRLKKKKKRLSKV